MKGQFFCKNTNCNLYNIEFEVAQNCPICKLPLTFVSNFTEFEKDIIENYPYVIAFPFKRMLEEGEYFTKFSLLIDVFVNTLKYNALILATEYFKSPFKSEEINRLFIEKLARPYHGHWNLFIDKAIDFLEQQNHSFFVTELPFAYHAVETGKKNNVVKKYEISKEFTNKQGKLKTYKEPMTAIWALLHYRNEKFAHTQTLSKETYKQLYYTCYAILKDFLVAGAYCKEYPMYKADRLYYYCLMGTTVKQSGRLTAEIKQDDNVWIQDSKGNRMSLLPFFVQPTQYIAGANADMQVLMYEGNTGQNGRMIFDSPESFKPEAQGEILNKFYDLLHSKQVLYNYTTQSFTKEKLKNHINQINNKIYNELKDEQKLIQGIYQKREEAEVALLSWVGARAGLFLLAAEAGAGKTNLLWDIKRQYEVWGNDTLMLRASRFSEDELEKELKKVLFLADDFSFTNSQVFQYTQGKPLMVLVDGGNEHANPENLLQGIFSFLQQFPVGAIKVVLSWRVNSQTDLPTLKEEWDELVYSPTSFSENAGLQKRHYWQPPLNKIELQTAWNNYVQHPTEKRYKVLFTLNELTLADRPLADQLHNPLLLKLFLELYCGKELVSKPKGFSNFWAIWWKERIGRYPRTAEFIIQLALLMASSQENRLPLDALYEDEIIGKHIRNYQIDSPYQQLLNSTMLTQFSIDNRLYVAFTIESVYHYALCQHLLRQPKIGFHLAHYTAKGKQWEQAVLYYLWDAVYKNKTYLLFAAIKNKDITIALIAKPLANAFLLMDTQYLVDSMLKNAGDREWEVLHESVDILEKGQIKPLSKSIVSKTNKWINLSFEKCEILISDYLEYFDYDFANVVTDKIFNGLDKKESTESKIRIIINIVAYLTNKGRAEQIVNLMSMIDKIEDEIPILSIDTQIDLFDKLGVLYIREGVYSKSIIYFDKILDLNLKLNFNEKKIAHCFFNMARLHRGMGNIDEAIQLLTKSLNIHESFVGNNHLNVGSILSEIADMFILKKEYSTALDFYTKAYNINESIYGNNSKEIALCLGKISHLYMCSDEIEKAIEYNNKGLSIAQNKCSPDDELLSLFYKNKFSLCEEEGEYHEALENLEEYHKINLFIYGENNLKHIFYYDNLAFTFSNRLLQYDNALESLNKSLNLYLRFYGEYHIYTANCHKRIADVFSMLGEEEKAINSYMLALDIREFIDKKDYLNIAVLYNTIGFGFYNKMAYNKALDYFLKTLNIYLTFKNNSDTLSNHKLFQESNDPKEMIQKIWNSKLYLEFAVWSDDIY